MSKDRWITATEEPAEQVVAADGGRMTVFRGTASLQRPPLLNSVVRLRLLSVTTEWQPVLHSARRHPMKRFAVLAVAVGLLLAADDPKADLDRLEGTWVLVSAEEGGPEVPREAIEAGGSRITFKGSDYIDSSRASGGEVIQRGSFRLDASQEPKELDLVPERGTAFRMIYSVEGDTLKIATSLDGKVRPKDFKSTNAAVCIYKRAKPGS